MIVDSLKFRGLVGAVMSRVLADMVLLEEETLPARSAAFTVNVYDVMEVRLLAV